LQVWTLVTTRCLPLSFPFCCNSLPWSAPGLGISKVAAASGGYARAWSHCPCFQGSIACSCVPIWHVEGEHNGQLCVNLCKYFLSRN
jgi:hypothetical protein